MGVESPVFSDKTMVLGTSGMTVMDQATGYNVFANGGYVGTRHGITQLATHAGEVVWDWRRDAPTPKRVLSEQAAASMNAIMVQIPETGTARRAALQGIRSAGKTGTTQAYKDAWYVGYTGNYTAAVWFGNDEFTPTRNMTGGSLPAMTWQRLMTVAHQNVELKPIPFIDKPFLDENGKTTESPAVAQGPVEGGEPGVGESSPYLSPRTTALLRAMSDLFRGSPRLSASAASETLSSL
jgi:penicillin-binding protein 1A